MRRDGRLGKQIVSALYADVADRMPAVADALPAADRAHLADAVAQLAAPALLAASPR